MPVMQRHYNAVAGISEDYFKVRTFFVELGLAEFTYARWDWMITHSLLEKEAVSRIGVWEEGGRVVAIATYDTHLGSAYCLTLPGYESLKKEMVGYAHQYLSKDGRCRVMISDTDYAYQDVVKDLGYTASDNKENDAIFYPDETSMEYKLPPGFHMTSIKETYDPYHYRLVLWKGFNHELNGEGVLAFDEDTKKDVDSEMLRPNVDLNLKVAVMGPQGNFVSYCGMWYDQKAGFAVVEPVATIPEYRRMGFGKAVVYEGMKRVHSLGAMKILVGSSQQFYYSIGFRPYASATEWISNG